MKEMENNNFIHTLDAVYNLCSEIKELVNVETEKQEDEGSEGIILLSDNLQRLQSEITEMKTELSYDKERRERLRTAINLRLKELRYIQFWVQPTEKYLPSKNESAMIATFAKFESSEQSYAYHWFQNLPPVSVASEYDWNDYASFGK